MTGPVVGPFPIEDLVLDAALQCRAAVVDAVVEEYAERWKGGTTFPPVTVIRHNGTLLLVDGWHRVAAAKRCGVKHIVAEVRDGSRGDAVAAAAGANSTHGLPRTNVDKRRAVRALLMDTEFCQLSGRKLAAMAGVSPPFVHETRKSYGLVEGEVLTAVLQAQMDGEPPPEWQRVLQGAPSYARTIIETIRRAPKVPDLAKLWTATEHGAEACRLRARELAIEDWPWAADQSPVARGRRAAHLDREEDIFGALASRDCPERARSQLYELLKELPELKRQYAYLGKLAPLCEGRPRLEQRLVEARLKQGKDAKGRSNYDLAQEVIRLPAEAQARAVFEASSELFNEIACRVKELHASVQDGVFRDRFGDPGIGPCARPSCDGWLLVRGRQDRGPTCVRCGRERDATLEAQRTALGVAGKLLEYEGYGTQAGRVVLDHSAVELLEALQAIAVSGPLERQDWWAVAPGALRVALRRWAGAAAPAMLVRWREMEGAPPPAPAADARDEAEVGTVDVQAPTVSDAAPPTPEESPATPAEGARSRQKRPKRQDVIAVDPDQVPLLGGP